MFLAKTNLLFCYLERNDHAVSTAEHAKPDIILDYNKSKSAVDSADKMIKEFSCNRISKRWPFVVFTHIISVCALNAYRMCFTKRNFQIQH